MSSSYDSKYGFIYLPKGQLNPYLTALIESEFDTVTDYDEQDILFEQNEGIIIRKVAISKLLMFPIEYFILRLFAGKFYSDEIKVSANLYWKFLRKQITIKEFKDQLLLLNRG